MSRRPPRRAASAAAAAVEPTVDSEEADGKRSVRLVLVFPA